jgi:hypothetical protein
MKTILSSVIFPVVVCILFAHSTYSIGSESTIYQLQNKLSVLGYDPGPVDGIWGGKTKSAMQLYQKNMGFLVTDRLDDDLINKLNIIPDGARSAIPEFRECVLAIAKNISKSYRLKVDWTGEGDEYLLGWYLQPKLYIESNGTPEKIFKSIDNLTKEDNKYLDKYREDCFRYLQS